MNLDIIPVTKIVIGIVSCSESDGCPDPSVVGDVLYNGSYFPKSRPSSRKGGEPVISQSFLTFPPYDVLNGSCLLTLNSLSIGVSGLRLVPLFSG